MRKLFRSVKQAVSEFVADSCLTSGAALAYYSIFALPPLVVLVFLLVNYAGVSQQAINDAIRSRLGIPTSAQQLQNLTEGQAGGGGAQGGEQQNLQPSQVEDEQQSPSLGTVAEQRTPDLLAGIGSVGKAVGIGILLFTATGLFAQLQTSLNRACGVEPDPEQGGVKLFFMKRLLSLLIIVVAVVLLLASTVLSTLMDTILSYLSSAAPSTLVQRAAVVGDNLLTLFLATLLFALIFKTLPDIDMAWRDLWVGALVTAALFVIGKVLISYYLRTADMGGSWGGAAASLIAVLAWFYYTSLIFLLGAEFTQVWARLYGSGIRAADGARRVRKSEREQ